MRKLEFSEFFIIVFIIGLILLFITLSEKDIKNFIEMAMFWVPAILVILWFNRLEKRIDKLEDKNRENK